MNILITGRPGGGKTTLIKEIFEKLGDKATGFYTEEVRKGGQRVGFRIRTKEGKEGVLSGVDVKSPYRVGKYKVDLASFESVALPAVEEAIGTPKTIIIDEIGPMELYSQKFKDAVKRALDSPNSVIATIKLRGSRFVEEIKSRKDVTVFNLDTEKKEVILKEVI